MSTAAARRVLAAHALSATAMAMPWPALLVQVEATTHDDVWLGLAGAARMLPYVLLSALAGMLADRYDRADVLRWSSVVRVLLLVGVAVASAGHQLGAAVVLAALVVAAGTPAYPAAVAGLPALTAGRDVRRWTTRLVTIEASAFVVGPALGGLLLGLEVASLTGPVAVLLAALALPLLRGVRAGQASAASPSAAPGRLRTVLASPDVRWVIGLVALANLTEAAASLALLPLSQGAWDSGVRGYGVGTAALGFGALAAPLLARLVGLTGGLRVGGGGLVVAGLAPTAWLGVAPLAAAGAASTVVECAATAVLQESVPERVRGFALGLTDAVMVSAAALGALLAPALATALGARWAFVLLAALVMVAPVKRRSTVPQGELVRPGRPPSPAS